MGFKKGQSGNPAGKPKGALDKRTELRELLKPPRAALVEKVVDMALGGDMSAMRLVLERISPPIRARDEPVMFEMTGTTLTEKADSVMKAIAAGQLTPEQGGRLLDALSACARIREVDELELRLRALEAEVRSAGDSTVEPE